MSDNTDRKAFEAWCVTQGWVKPPTARPNGTYINGSLQARWLGWQAGAAASRTEALREAAQAWQPIVQAQPVAATVRMLTEDAKDATRYRWLRDKSEPGICAFYLSVGQAFKGVRFARETVDTAIDAAIEREHGIGGTGGEHG